MVKFRDDYDEYVRLISSFNTYRTLTNRLCKSTVHVFVNVDLLENLIMTEAVNDVDNESNLSHVHVMSWYCIIIDKETAAIVDIIVEVFRKHRHVPMANTQKHVYRKFCSLP